MKKSTLLKSTSAILVYCALLSLSFATSSGIKEMTLQEAIATKSIDVKFLSNGKYSGTSIIAQIKNSNRSKIKLTIPAGTLYHPEDNGEQSLIQLEDVYLTLLPSSSETTSIAAFCSEANDRSPSSNSTMQIGKSKDPSLLKMITYLKKNSVNKESYQDAVWAISDKKSVSNIVADDSSTRAFRTFIATITNQKDTWFTSPQHVQVDNQGNFIYETVNIAGKISFDCSKGDKVRQDIYHSNGEPVFVSEKYMTAQTNHVNYSFRLKVKGWEKGEYYIRIHNGIKDLATYEFSV